MFLLHKAVLAVSMLFAAVWTFLFWRIAFPRRRLGGTCAHRWHRIETYADGRAKARCLTCGKVAIVSGKADRARPV